jgi:hypothetical protein
MRKVSSCPSFSAPSAPKTPKRSVSTAAVDGLISLVSELQLETVINAPISTTVQCLESYGFPKEVLGKPQQTDLATCLATPEDFGPNFENNAYVPRRNPQSHITQTFLYTASEFDKRYARFYEMIHRRRKKERDSRRES